MTNAFPALGVAFAAFCVWLGVRIYNRRERWAKWTAVVMVVSLPVLYVLSFGPACWLSDRDALPYGLPEPLYRPLVALGMYAHCDRALEWYGTLAGLPDLPPDTDGGTDCRIYTAVGIRVNLEYNQ
jgi:hypothetical protein